MYIPFFICVCVLSTVAARKLTDEELHSLPKLFHLDDYERCLAPKNGLYCLGTFELTASRPLPILDLMKEHTNQRQTFNRTLIRRGYCVSQRCPTTLRESNPALREPNSTLRFERCVAKQALRYALTPQLKKLHFCTTHQQRQDEATRAPTEAQIVFLYAVCGILLLNVIGTMYHCYMGECSNKNNFLMAWSLLSNWERFTKIERSGRFAALLAPLQCTRLVVQLIVIVVHTVLSHHLVYVQNAEFLESGTRGLIGVMIRNGTSLVQFYILIASFLTGYNLLRAAYTTGVSAKMLLKWILKRLARILPVYLLVIGFVASWWPRTADGPQFNAIVGNESQICRNKFWSLALFINNLVDPTEVCLLQTWAFAVDMQLYILSTLLTLLLMRLKVRAVPVLAFLFAASGLLNIVLAYVNGWEPLVKIFSPENLRHLSQNTSYRNTHISTWGNLPGCFLGLLLAHLYFEKTNKKAKIEDKPEQKSKINGRTQNSSDVNNGPTKNGVGEKNGPNRKGVGKNNEPIRNVVDKYSGLTRNGVGENNGSNMNGVDEKNGPTSNLLGENNGPNKNGLFSKIQNQVQRHGYIYSIISLVAWIVLTAPIENIESPALTAMYVGLEPIVFILMVAVILMQLYTVDNFLRRIMTWYVWQALGRLAFCVTLLHWCINLSIVAGRSEAIGTSPFYIFEDFLATVICSYLLALPVCLLVELPAQKFLDLLISHNI